MDFVPVVCSIVIAAATVALLDGRTFPAEAKNDFVGDGSSVWPTVKASSGKN
ncbi:unnamed protein product, partial [Aphanomyces euteiches]